MDSYPGTISTAHRARLLRAARALRLLSLLCVMILLCLATPSRAEATVEQASLTPPSSEPALRLAARGAFNVPAARAGDTILYRLRVEWDDIPAAVMLLPGGTLDAPGFLSAGVSTIHRKSSMNGTVVNVTEFTYALVPREPGTAKVAPFTLRYHNGLTGREESVDVPGSLLEIAPARKPLMQRTGARILAVLVVITALAGFWRRLAVRRASRRRMRRLRTPNDGGTSPTNPDESLSAGLASLKRRCDTADSRVWLADAERLCTEFLCGKLGVAKPAHVRFEAALDQYLERNASFGPADPETASAWSKLQDLFHEARYAGGRREPHELREALRLITVCLQPSSLRLSKLEYQGERQS